MFLNRIQETLAVGDEESAAVKPLVQDVLAKRRDTMGGGMRVMMRGRGRRGDAQNEDGPTETQALQETLDNADAGADEVKAKLAAFRTARDQKEQALQAAREKLRAVLTAKQEAQLVLMGILD